MSSEEDNWIDIEAEVDALPQIDKETVERFLAEIEAEPLSEDGELALERNKGGRPRVNLTDDERYEIWQDLVSGFDLNMLEAKYCSLFRTNRAGIILAIETYVSNLEEHTPELEKTLLIEHSKRMQSSLVERLHECQKNLRRYDLAQEKIDRLLIESKTRADELYAVEGDGAFKDELTNLAKMDDDLLLRSLDIARVRQLEVAAIAKLSAEIAKYTTQLSELTGAKNLAGRIGKRGEKGVRRNDNVQSARPTRSPEELRAMIEKAKKSKD